MQEPKEVTKEVDSMVVLDLAWAHCSSLKIREEYPDKMNTTLSVRQFSDIQKKANDFHPIMKYALKLSPYEILSGIEYFIIIFFSCRNLFIKSNLISFFSRLVFSLHAVSNEYLLEFTVHVHVA